MIDSVLKGTGNSRFLKSAVPAGTSWADALAMLQAGTFPIDFNGINTEGFQQVGTPLNKANLLKDATAAQIGLPPSTTPDGMFQALGNTGELHVWRKTVVVKEPVPEVPGSYTLGSAAITNLARMTSNGYNGYAANILVSKEIKVNLDGSVELVSPTSRQMIVAGSSESYTIDVNSDDLLGAGNRYFTPSKDSDLNSSRCTLLIPPGTVYYVAPGTTYATAERSIGFTSAFNAAQLVTGVPGTPATPAGTTTTYPVSTNPNAYQEGDDAKAATYVLGDVAQQFLGANSAVGSGVQMGTYYSNSVAVTDDGTVSLVGEQESVWTLNSSGSAASNIQATLRGKYFRCVGYSGVKAPSGIFYMPNDAVVAYDNTGAISGSETSFCYYADRVARVTGQAAIPTGTTIEYLGKLGDKARVQVVSYVGTGTYGESNPNSLTFDFVPKLVIISSAPVQNSYVYIAIMVPDAGIYSVVMSTYLGYESRTPGGSGIVTKNNKTITFYSGDNTAQLNGSGIKYYAAAIG